MIETRRFLSYLSMALCLFSLPLAPTHAGQAGEWRSYGGEKTSSKYAPLEQIHRDNVGQLRIAWRWNSIDNEILAARPELWTMVNEATPLMVDGVIYTSTALSQVAALDAATGQTLWTYTIQKPIKTAPRPTRALCTAGSPTGRTGTIAASSWAPGMRT